MNFFLLNLKCWRNIVVLSFSAYSAATGARSLLCEAARRVDYVTVAMQPPIDSHLDTHRRLVAHRYMLGRSMSAMRRDAA